MSLGCRLCSMCIRLEHLYRRPAPSEDTALWDVQYQSLMDATTQVTCMTMNRR